MPRLRALCARATVTMVALGAALVLAPSASPCTTFVATHPGGPVVGKSYDWSQGMGLVVLNPRGLKKRALCQRPEDRPAEWVARHASVTFNQYGREFPCSGMNDAGLVAEIMWLNESEYPEPDGRPTVNELQWIQHVLDRCATTEEVVEAAGELRVSPVYARVHYLVADRGGSAAVLEYLGGRLVVWRGERLPVPTLTNDPYERSRSFLEEHAGFGGDRPVGGSARSLDRFCRASALARAIAAEDDATKAAFAVLDSVSQGAFSQWNIVYRPEDGEVAFRTRACGRVKHLDLGRLGLETLTQARILDIDLDAAGDVSERFEPYSTEANRALVRRSMAHVARSAGLPPEALEQLARYPETLRAQPAPQPR